MISAIKIKKDIDFNTRFRSLLEVMKLVAVSQYHQLESRFQPFEKLAETVGDFFRSFDVRSMHHPFIDAGTKPPAIVAVTSDAGLLGGLNMQVMSHAIEMAQETGGRLVIIGEKGVGYAQDAGLGYASYPGIIDEKRYQQAAEISRYLTKKVLSGSLGGVKVVYTKAYSIVLFRVEVATLLPITEAKFVEDAVHNREELSTRSVNSAQDVILESSPEGIVEYLALLSMQETLFQVFGLARIAEQAARFTHLEESCGKILDMNKKLTLQYFKRRHEVIDSNMRELFTARSLYARSQAD